MKIVQLLIFIILVSSCTFPEVGVNKFAKLQNGLDRNDAKTLIKENPSTSKLIQIGQEKYFYDIYMIPLEVYSKERTEYRPNYNYNQYDDYKKVTETTTFSYPFVLLYKDNKLIFQGFIWEYKINESAEINNIGTTLSEVILGY